MADFQVNVEEIASREHIITTKCATPVRKELFYQYLPQGIELPVINVDIGFPIYRMANWRTRTKQFEHIHSQKLPVTYFQNGEEDVSAQRVQHTILVDFAKRGRGETIIPILQKLRQDHRQMESLLVTSTGVVVNGNRRLAGMRELFAEDPGVYSFQTIQVAVLPAGLTSQELKKIEFQLQMQQETKLPYDWAIQCLSVRELAESGVGHTEIMHMMRLGRVEDVQAMITRLNEGELYLNDYLKTPESYAAIERQEQQFIELQKAIDRKSDSDEKELARKMCYPLTKHSRELETRAYDFKIAFGKETAEVAKRLAERMEIELPEVEPGDDQSLDSDDSDDVFADETGFADRFEPLKQLLEDQEKSEKVAETIAEICIEIKEEKSDEADAKKPLKLVRKAKGSLLSVNLSKAGNETIADIQIELNQVVELAQVLLSEAASLPSNAS